MERKRRVAVLAAPVAGLAAAAVLLSMSLGSHMTASANVPNAGLEFTLHVGGCSTAGDAKGNCAVTQGSTFVASVSLDAIPYPYYAVAVNMAYTGVDSKDNPDMVWPDCTLEVSAPPNGTFVYSGCAVGIGAPASTFTGTVFTASFNCAADGQLSLTHGPADTLIIDYYDKTSTETGPDVLNIDCAPATATPVPTPTPPPPPVGGIAFKTGTGAGGSAGAGAFETGTGAGGSAGAGAFAIGVALLLGCGVLTFVGWRLRGQAVD